MAATGSVAATGAQPQPVAVLMPGHPFPVHPRLKASPSPSRSACAAFSEDGRLLSKAELLALRMRSPHRGVAEAMVSDLPERSCNDGQPPQMTVAPGGEDRAVASRSPAKSGGAEALSLSSVPLPKEEAEEEEGRRCPAKSAQGTGVVVFEGRSVERDSEGGASGVKEKRSEPREQDSDWRHLLAKGHKVEVFTRDGHPRWARAVVISARRQNISAKFAPMERRDGDIHVILPRTSRKMRRPQLPRDECLRSKKSARKRLPLPREGECPDPDCPGGEDEQEQKRLLEAAAVVKTAFWGRPHELQQRAGDEDEDYDSEDGETLGEVEDSSEVSFGPRCAWDFPLDNAEKFHFLVILFQAEVEQCEKEITALQNQNIVLKSGALPAPSLTELDAVLKAIAPLEAEKAVLPDLSSLRGLHHRASCDFPLSRREKLQRLLKLFQAKSLQDKQEVKELHEENRALWRARLSTKASSPQKVLEAKGKVKTNGAAEEHFDAGGLDGSDVWHCNDYDYEYLDLSPYL